MSTYPTPYDIFPKQDFSSIEGYVSYVSSLPKPIRSILIQFETAEFIGDKLAPQFSLRDEQVINLTKIIRDVLIATLFIGDLTQAISQEVQVDSVTAKKISDMLIGELFTPAIQDIKELQKKYFSDRLSGGAGQSAPSQPQSSQTINLRSQTPTAPPRPTPSPVDPIIASLKTQSAPRPTPPQSTPLQPQENRAPQTSPQPQPNPQKTQNVFKIPDIDFGSDQPQSQPKQDGPKNVLDLRDQN
jgi:hypothetical protein